VWGVQELEYLGHKISAAGVLPLPSHVAAIQDFPRPTIIKELQAFLGMVNFYRRFLPSIARTLRPLTDALRGGRKGADKLEWSAAMDAAFAGAKQSLLTATHLAHPTVDRLKPNTGMGPDSPAEAASRGRPPRMPAAPSVQPAPS
jgi:hypothetical protein